MEQEPAPRRSRWSVYRPTRSKVSEPEPGTTQTKPGPGPTQRSPERDVPSATARRPRTSPVGVVVGIGAVLVVLGISGLFAFLGSDRDGSGPFGGGEVEVLTEDGVADFVAAVEEKTGSTEVFSATLYPHYAVVRVPVDGRTQREVGYYWDGHDLEEWGSKGTSSYERFDLADIDTDLLLPLVRRAKAQIEDPNSWYVILDHSGDDDGWISAYASNEYSEGGYIEVDLDGTEVRRATWPDPIEP